MIRDQAGRVLLHAFQVDAMGLAVDWLTTQPRTFFHQGFVLTFECLSLGLVVVAGHLRVETTCC
jgi:hypothetical protein